MDYKKKFEDFLDKMQGLLDSAKKQGHIIVRVEDIENTFPELKESKDEKIRGAILTGLIDCRDAPDLGWSNFGGIPIDDCIAWLEKRRKVDNSNKVESKFNVGDWVVFNNDHESVYQIEEIDNFQYILRHILGGSMLLSFSSEDMIRHWTIQDAKDGDVLVDEDNNIGLYHEEKYGLDDWDWESYIYLGCDNRLYGFSLGGYHSIKNTKPATKEQSDLLFQKMKEKGYEWNAEKKELKKIEENSFESDRVVKALRKAGYEWSEETHQMKKIDNANKVEQKFHECEWIAHDGLNTAKIISIEGDRYEVEFIDGNKDFAHIDYIDRIFHLWSIEDAKDGDILVASDESIFIYAGSTDRHAKFYVALTRNERINVEGGNWEDKNSVHPATKEQSDLLFQKMKEKGYEWDAEKKELKKIEFNPDDLIEESYQQQADNLINMVTEKPTAWSEEDDRERKRIIGLLEGWLSTFKETNYAEDCKCGIDWLKSLRPQNRWKPSKEQMEALEHFIVYHNGSTNYAKDLEELRLQLKKLK